MKKDALDRKRLVEIVRERAISNDVRMATLQSIYKHVLTNSKSIRGGNFKSISSEDLGMLFQVTDEHFFEGTVGRICERRACKPLSFRLSTRMTNSGGMTTMQSFKRGRNAPVQFEIAIATTPLFSSFRNDSNAVVSGVRCSDRLQALQRIMEHEMVHLVEMLLWNDSNCAAGQFKGIVSRLFGHTESNHQLLTPSDLARRQLGISAGDLVIFNHEGRRLKGHVNRITKRATVLVAHPKGILYDDGNKYQKFYVPLNRLKRA